MPHVSRKKTQRIWALGSDAVSKGVKSVDRLLCFVRFEKGAGFFEGEEVSADGELVDAGVVRDGEDVLDVVTVLPEGCDEKIDVYHG